MQQNTALRRLFDSITREVGSTNIAPRDLPLEATDEGLGKEEALFDCFDRSWIRNFANTWHQGYGKTW